MRLPMKNRNQPSWQACVRRLASGQRSRLFPILGLLPDDLQHRVGVGRLFQGLAEVGPVQKLGDVGESVEVLLELALRDKEEHDKIHRLIIQSIEIDAGLRAP